MCTEITEIAACVRLHVDVDDSGHETSEKYHRHRRRFMIKFEPFCVNSKASQIYALSFLSHSKLKTKTGSDHYVDGRSKWNRIKMNWICRPLQYLIEYSTRYWKFAEYSHGRMRRRNHTPRTLHNDCCTRAHPTGGLDSNHLPFMWPIERSFKWLRSSRWKVNSLRLPVLVE